MRIRWTFGLLFAVAALFVVVMPAAAGKTDNHDSLNPQGANIPYLAWVGENVKLVRAFHWATDFPSIADHSGDGFAAELAVVEWTGDQNYKPYVIGGTLDASTHHYHGPFLEIRGGELTAQGDVVDTHPGIAKIKLFVTYKGDLVKEQTFEVAWMTLVKPTLHEMSNADLAALSDKPMSLGDPAGDGKFVPMPVHKDGKDLLTSRDHGTTNDFGLGLLQVKVTGTFPFPGGPLTMPGDWAKLAADPVFGAVDQSGPNLAAWDIHGHAIATHHNDDEDLVMYGGFLKVGPFDPVVFPVWQTMFPDGTVDSLDAPMPADRIDFSIAAGGVGTFATAEKDDIYVASGERDWDGHAWVAKHNWEDLYAPFYQAYIPSTARDGGSGIDAADYAGNFPDFLIHGKYTFWTVLNPQVVNADRAKDPNTCLDELGQHRVSPAGVPDTVSVYTDEHGEAIVAYDPDAGFYFTADSNNRCDLGTGAAPVLLGKSVITATAVYPYEQAAGGSVASDPVTKSVYGLPMKALTFTAKSKTEAVVTETIHDIYGNPVAGAVVQFSADPAGPKLVKEISATDAVFTSNGAIQLTTDKNGQVAVDVIASHGQVDVTAENIGTRVNGAGVLRDMIIDYSGALPKVVTGTAPVTPPASDTGGGGSGGGGGSSSSSSSSTTTTTVTTPATTTTTTVVTPVTPIGKTIVAKVLKVKLVKATVGRYVTVQVTSNASKAKVLIKLLKGSKVIKTTTRNIPTNRLVRLGGLTIPKVVTGVSAGIAH